MMKGFEVQVNTTRYVTEQAIGYVQYLLVTLVVHKGPLAFYMSLH